ncbi:MAG: metallophosphoesterase [Tannerellaceae bacterium]|nr:metallophosphoesterase [Tannerellaceae bacterium]
MILIIAFLIVIIGINADIIMYRFIRTLSNFDNKIFLVFSVFSILYSIGFLIVYGFDLIYFHNMRWGVFLFLLFNIPKLLFLLYWLIVVFPFSRRQKSQYELNMIIGVGIAGITMVLIIYGAAVGRTRLIVKEETIALKRLPEGFDGFRIVQFSDFHLGSFGKNTRFVKRVVKKINELKPDIIFFTGDIVNDRSVEMEPFLDVLSNLEAPYGVYSILGNHDYGDYYDWNHPDEKERNFERLMEIEGNWGWILLKNEHRYITRNNDTIVIVGVENWGEPPFQQYGDLEKAYGPVDKQMFTILLSHDPSHWHGEVLPTTDIDLMLAGHTHAFQLRFGNLSPAVLKYKEWAGLYDHFGQKMYVNQGVGNTFYPMRIGAFPELTVLTLRTSPEDIEQ